MRLVLYEPEARVRATLAARLRETGHDVRECWSPHMVASIMAREARDCPPTVIGEARNAALFDSGPVRFIPYLASEVAQKPEQALLLLLGRLTEAQRNSARPDRARYRFDLICIGSSTGGFPVVQAILENLEVGASTIVVCQHIGAQMANDLGAALQSRVRARVEVVERSTRIAPGLVYLLGGAADFHFIGKRGQLWLVEAPCATTLYHPSFDRLLESVLTLGDASVGIVVLSGLAEDGAKHLCALKRAGATIVAQLPSEAVAPGMPTAALKTGAVARAYSTVELRDFTQRSVK